MKSNKIKYGSLMFIIGLFCFPSFSQRDDFANEVGDRLGGNSLLPLHPIGLLSSRLDPNFKLAPSHTLTFKIDHGSGNVWAPFMNSYIPKTDQGKETASQYPDHVREFRVSLSPEDNDSIIYSADGVLKSFTPQLTIPLSHQREISLTLRTFLLTKGKFPFSGVTSDGFIEWFHSNIKGGEDPFARRRLRMNEAGFYFRDEKGNELTLDANTFVIAGLQADHFWYFNYKFPLLGRLDANFGIHGGLNTTNANPSLDVGFSHVMSKSMQISKNTDFMIGVGLGVLRKNIISFNDYVEFGTNPYLFNLNVQPKFVHKQNGNNRYIVIAGTYYYQSAYRSIRENDYWVMTGEGRYLTSHWSIGLGHMNNSLEVYTISCSFLRKRTFTFYVMQDFKVNNSSDIQTGVAYSIPIN